MHALSEVFREDSMATGVRIALASVDNSREGGGEFEEAVIWSHDTLIDGCWPRVSVVALVLTCASGSVHARAAKIKATTSLVPWTLDFGAPERSC